MSKELRSWIRGALQKCSVACENSADLSKCDKTPGALVQLCRHSVHQYPSPANQDVLWCDMADLTCYVPVRIKANAWKGLHTGIVVCSALRGSFDPLTTSKKHLGGLFTIKSFNILYTRLPILPKSSRPDLPLQTEEPQLCLDILELSLYQSHIMTDPVGLKHAAEYDQFFPWRKNLLVDYYDRLRTPDDEELAAAWGDFDINNLHQFIPPEWLANPYKPEEIQADDTPKGKKSSTQSSIPNPSFEYRGTPEEQRIQVASFGRSGQKVQVAENGQEKQKLVENGKGKAREVQEVQTQMYGAEEQEPSSSWERNVRESSYASTQVDEEPKGDDTVMEEPVKIMQQDSPARQSIPPQLQSAKAKTSLSAPAETSRPRMSPLTSHPKPSEQAPRIPAASTSAQKQAATGSHAPQYPVAAMIESSKAAAPLVPSPKQRKSASPPGGSPTSEHSFRSTKSRRPTSAHPPSPPSESFRSTKTRRPTAHPNPRKRKSFPLDEAPSSPALEADTSNNLRAKELPFYLMNFDKLLSPPPEAQRKGRKSLWKEDLDRLMHSESLKELRDCAASERNRTPSWSVSPQVSFPARPTDTRTPTNSSEMIEEPVEDQQEAQSTPEEARCQRSSAEPNDPGILSRNEIIEEPNEREEDGTVPEVEPVEQNDEAPASVQSGQANDQGLVDATVSEEPAVVEDTVSPVQEALVEDSDEELMYVDLPKLDKGKGRAVDLEEAVLEPHVPVASTSAQPYDQQEEEEDDDLILPPVTKPKARKAESDETVSTKRQRLSSATSRSRSSTSHPRRSTPTSASSVSNGKTASRTTSKEVNEKEASRSATPREVDKLAEPDETIRDVDVNQSRSLPPVAERTSTLSYAAQARLALDKMKYTNRGKGSRRLSAQRFKELAETM